MPLVLNADLPHLPDAAIVVDGVADEAAWASAYRVDSFRGFSPVPDQEPTHGTRARLLADDHALYLLFEAGDPEPGKLRASIGRHDTRFSDDFVGFYLDTAGTAQRAYVFIVTAGGVQCEGTAMPNVGEDYSWDVPWDAAVRVGKEGYVVEVAIPWKAVRHPAVSEKTGIFLFRSDSRLGEKSSWPTVDPDVNGLLLQEAVLRGPGTLPASAGISLGPELTFGWTESGPPSDRWGWEGVSPGFTGRWLPDPGLSVLGSVNPDFSQVESDASQIDVNRRYALYYEEKRPFFLEGQEWFSHAADDVTYTRSIVTPRYGLRSTVEKGQWTGAVLHALDATPGPTVSEGGGWTEEDLEGQAALVTLARGRRAVGTDGYVGLLYSDRTLPGADLANRVGGADASVRLNDTTVVSGAALGSWTRFGPDDDRSDLLGQVEVDWGNKSWGWWTQGQYIGPDFRAENGFITRADQWGANTWAGYTGYPDRKILKSFTVGGLEGYGYWNTAGELRNIAYSPHLKLSFAGNRSLFLGYGTGGDLYEGAWLPWSGPYTYVNGRMTSWLTVYLFGTLGEAPYYDPADPHTGQSALGEVSLGLQPADWTDITLSATYEDFWEHDGTGVYQATVARAKWQVFASRALWARAIADLSMVRYPQDPGSDTVDLSSEALVAWEPSPGQAVYVGGQVGLADPLTWQAFAKVSWLFSL